MAILGVSSAITAGFIQKLAAKDGSSSTGSVLSGTDAVKTTLSGIQNGVKIFSNSVAGLNNMLSTLNITRDSLTKLSAITDDMIVVVDEATKSGIGTFQRSELDAAFRELVSKFQNVLAKSSGNDFDTLQEADLEKIFKVLGFDKQKSSTFAQIIKKFTSVENSDGKLSLASDKSQAERPVPIPSAAYQTQVTTYSDEGSGSFSVASTWTEGTGNAYVDMNLEDINNDGNLDIVGMEANKAIVRLGNGDGTFQISKSYVVSVAGGYSGNLSLVDINGDSKLDIVTGAVDSPNSNMSTFVSLANSDGSYNAPISSPVEFIFSDPVAATYYAQGVDMDGLGAIDLVTAYGSDVYLQLGNTDGTYDFLGKFAATPGSTIVGLQTTSTGDIVTVSSDLLNTLTVNVMTNLGGGSYSASVSYNGLSGHDVNGFSVADINNDGFDDIAVTDSINGKVQVMLANNDGTYKAPVSYTAGTASADSSSVKAADLNGDTYEDLIVTNPGDKTVSVLLGNSNGTYQAPISSPMWANVSTLSVGDTNQDGRTDLVAGTTSDRYVLGLGQPIVTTSMTSSSTSTDYDFLFEADRSITRRPDAFRMLADLNALKTQLADNIKAIDDSFTFVIDNLYMLRSVGLAFLAVANDFAKKTPNDADAIAKAVQSKMRNIPIEQVRQLQNLDALVTASMSTSFSKGISSTA